MTFFLQLLLLCCICISWLHSSDQNSTYQNEQALRDAISEGSQFLLQNQNEDENKDKPIDKYTTVFAPDPATPAHFHPKTKEDEGVSPAYPTDSKERENERRRRLKEEGHEVEVKKKKIPVE